MNKIKMAFGEFGPCRLATAALAFAVAQSALASDSLGCLIEPSRVADVGSPVVGVLRSVDVERGDIVKKGQVLATLRADVERAQVSVANSRAQADGELQAAQKAHEFAQKKLERTQDLFNKEFVSSQALDQAAAEAQVAEARWQQAKEQARHSGKELNLANAQLELRTIRAPIDGVVIDRYRDAGERIEDKPIMKIATIDPLRVEVVLPAILYGRVVPGLGVTVSPDLVSLSPVQGRVSLVDRVIDPASNTFRARLELPNPDSKLPAGMRCKVRFPPDVTAGLPSVAPPPARAASAVLSTQPLKPVAQR